MNRPMREGFQENDPVEIDGQGTQAAPRAAPPATAAPSRPTPPPAADEEQIAFPELPEWPMIIELRHKPIMKSQTEEVRELTFREPTAMDILRCGGNPCRIEITEVNGTQVVYNPIIDDRKMITMMAQLSGILEPFIQKMDPRDYASCAHRLRRFFLPEQGIW